MKARALLKTGLSAAKAALRQSPFALIAEVTSRCNLRCSMCSVWKTFDFKEAPAAKFAETINFFEKQGAETLYLTGGEPLLRKDLKEILAKVGTFNMITTNGFFLRERLPAISDYIGQFFVSLDSPIAEEHDRIRGVKGSFERAIAGIKEARSIGIPVNVVATVMESNFGQLERLCQLSKELDCLLSANYLLGLHRDYREKQVYFNNENKGVPPKQFVERVQAMRKKHRHFIATDFELSMIKSGGNSTLNPTCRAGQTVIGIKPDGKVALPCTHYPLRYVSPEQWKREKYRSGGTFKFCEGCQVKCFVNLSLVSQPRKWPSSFTAADLKRIMGNSGLL